MAIDDRYFGSCSMGAFQPANDGNLYANKYDEFVHLKPSEMGDALAGVFSALAFVWIIVTVMMQSKELMLQRNELKLTRSETKRTADALGKQVEVLKDEQSQRQEDRAMRLLAQKLGTLRNSMDQSHLSTWRYAKDESGDFPVNEIRLFRSSDLGELPRDIDAYVWEQSLAVLSSSRRLAKIGREFQILQKPVQNHALDICQQLSSIVALEAKLSEDQRERIHKIGLYVLREKLIETVRMDIWQAEDAPQ